MRRVITETIKICILGILILISLIILEKIYEPVSVKATRVLGQGKYIGHEFTKEEMDEYMIYLKSGKIFKQTILFDQED
mgnify:FL=1